MMTQATAYFGDTGGSSSGPRAPQQQFEHILFPRAAIHEHAGRLARFLAGLRYDDIPDDVVHLAKLITLDTIGCIIAGATPSWGHKSWRRTTAGTRSTVAVFPPRRWPYHLLSAPR
jgi:hypothetical protein